MPNSASTNRLEKTSRQPNEIQGESEIRDLQFKLTHKLQSTLEVTDTLELFFVEVTGLVKLCGLRFETSGSPALDIGEISMHQARYNISGGAGIIGHITFFRNTQFLEAELAALEMFISILFHPLRNALLYQEALASSLRDTLTGIGNRRAMELAFEREIKLAKRHGQALSLLFADIDHFKAVNDNYGHSAGDDLLVHLAQNIQSTMRDTDQVFRYGGEEFIVLLNNTSMGDARFIAERIRRSVAKTPLAYESHKICATISIGISSLGESDNIESLLKRADTALYIAKNTGRNKIQSTENIKPTGKSAAI